MDSLSDSAELYAACRDPQPAVQARAYEQLAQYLYRAALYLLRDQPAPEALAQDCAQIALIRVHQHLLQCREPEAFRTWARQIVSRLAIDELRRRERLAPLEAEPDDEAPGVMDPQTPLEAVALETASLAELRQLLRQAPISERSRRVVTGRYLDDLPDEVLAHTESQLTRQAILPSHVQVTRAKDIAKLRAWEPLRASLGRQG